jgi:hypothetical protein
VLCQWIHIADAAALEAAQTISQLILENAAVKTTIDDFCASRKALGVSIDVVCREMCLLEDDLCHVKSDVALEWCMS